MTSRSRAVSSSSCSGLGNRGSGCEASSVITRRMPSGESAASPAATLRRPCTRWPGSISRDRNPLAPARRDEKISSSRSDSPRMRTWTGEESGWATIRRVTRTASMPGAPTAGGVTSIKSTSGRICPAKATASRSLAADPATAISASVSSSAASPARASLPADATKTVIVRDPEPSTFSSLLTTTRLVDCSTGRARRRRPSRLDGIVSPGLVRSRCVPAVSLARRSQAIPLGRRSCSG